MIKRYEELMTEMRENLAYLDRYGVPYLPAEIGFERQPPDDLEEQLEILNKEMDACRVCHLASERFRRRGKCVPGGGNSEAIVMVVGEGPGKMEEVYKGSECSKEYGFPFVGPSGQLLNKMLRLVGLKREEVYFSNVVHCLHTHTRVYFPDGRAPYIGDLYKENYRGLVLSYDTDTGHFVAKRVTNIIKSSLGHRQWLKVTYEGAKQCGDKGPAGAVVTNDHEFLTKEGDWVAAENLDGQVINIGPHGMNYIARQVAIGTLLGDAHISYQRAGMSMGHQPSQKAWLILKMECLSLGRPFNISKVRVKAKSGEYDQYRSYTSANRYLAYLRREFYTLSGQKGAEKIVPSWLINEFTPLTAAVLFCDDGYTRVTPNTCYDECEIATCAFNDASLNVLCSCFRKLGIESTIAPTSQRLRFARKETHKLLSTIAKFVPPCMRYKLGKYEPTFEPFDGDSYESIGMEPLYVQAIVYPITKSDRSCYCLEVEDTHNFVTPAGVVHNCRAWEVDFDSRRVKDRYPSPQEVSHCLPFVRKQIRLIQPWLIITAGGSSGPTLLDKPLGTKISEIKDQLFDYPEDPRIKVWPMYHPAYLLRNESDRISAGLMLKHLRAIVGRAKKKIEGST